MRNWKLYLSVMASIISAIVLTGCANTAAPATDDKKSAVEEALTSSEDMNDAKTETEDIQEVSEEQSIIEDEDDNNAEIIAAMSDIELLEAYLGMGEQVEVRATVDEGVCIGYDNSEAVNCGEAFTFDELSEYLKNSIALNGGNNVPLPSFSIISYPENSALILKYSGMNIYSDGDDSSSVFVIKRLNDGLHITYSYDDWVKNTSEIYVNGYIYTEMYGGASARYITGGMLDESGQYQKLFDQTRIYGWNELEEMDSDKYDELIQNNDDSNISFDIYTIGDDKYYSYNADYGHLTQGDEEYLELVEESGITLYNDDEIHNEIVKHNEAILKDDEFDWYPAVAFSGIKKGDELVIPASLSYWTVPWNYKELQGVGIEPDESDIISIKNAGTTTHDASVPIDFMEFNQIEEPTCIFMDSITCPEGEFKYYISKKEGTIIVTPDDKIIRMGCTLYNFQYDLPPELVAQDFDEDGESELYIKFLDFHGTGLNQESLLILDNASWEDGDWIAYHLTPQTYISMLCKEPVLFEKDGKIINRLPQTEEIIEKYEDEAEMYTIMDSIVSFSTDGKIIDVEISPALASNKRPIEIVTGKTLHLLYKGNGEFAEQ